MTSSTFYFCLIKLNYGFPNPLFEGDLFAGEIT
jgi:hypothetical protein